MNKKITLIVLTLLFAANSFSQKKQTHLIKTFENGILKEVFNDRTNVEPNIISEKNSVILTITTSEVAGDLIVINEFNQYGLFDFSWDGSHTTATIDIIPGTYDIISMVFNPFGSKYLIKEEITIVGPENIDLDFSESTNLISVDAVGANNEIVADQQGSSGLLLLVGPENFPAIGYGLPVQSNHINSFSSRWTISLTSGYLFLDEGNSYAKGTVVHFDPIVGLSSNLTLTNSPSDFSFKHVTTPLSKNGTLYNINVNSLTYFRGVGEEDWTTFGFSGGTYYSTQENFEFDLYQTPTKSPFLGNSYAPVVRDDVNNSFTTFSGQPLFYQEDTDSFISWVPDNNIGRHESPEDEIITYGLGAIYAKMRFLNNYFGQNNISGIGMFLGQHDENRWQDRVESQLEVFDNTNTLITTMPNSSFNYYTNYNLPVDQGVYSVETVNSNYSIAGTAGELKLTANFDTSRVDANPPEITTFRIENEDGQLTESIPSNGVGTIYFGVGDFVIQNAITDTWTYQQVNQTATESYFKAHGTNTWVSIPNTFELEGTQGKNPVGSLYSISTSLISSTLNPQSGDLIDIKLVTKDNENNTTTMLLEPAYVYGEEILGIDSFLNDIASIYPNPSNGIFTVTGNNLDKIELFEKTGKLIYQAKINETESNQFDFSHFSEGVYFVKIHSLEHGSKTVKLILDK